MGFFGEDKLGCYGVVGAVWFINGKIGLLGIAKQSVRLM